MKRSTRRITFGVCAADQYDAGLDVGEAPQSACYVTGTSLELRVPLISVESVVCTSGPCAYDAHGVYAYLQRNSGNMASSLSAKQPVINCCGCCQHSIQLKLLTTARQLPAHSARRQTAICATSTSTNTCVVVRTHSQQRIGLRSHLGRRPVTLQRAYGESNGSSKDPSLQDYVEVKIESVKVNAGTKNK